MYLPAASGNDYQKERQFKKINSQKDSIEVPAVRSGKQIVLKNTDVLVGDVLLLNTGDKVTSADATLLTHAFLWQSCLQISVKRSYLAIPGTGCFSTVLPACLHVQVIADGLVIESFGLVIDEASLTGESDPMHKGPKDPWCRSGTQVHASALQHTSCGHQIQSRSIRT